MATKFIPAPYAGINLETQYFSGELNEAMSLINWLPERDFIKMRPGLTTWAKTDPNGAGWLHTYYKAAGDTSLIVTTANKFYLAAYDSNLTDITGGTAPTQYIWCTAQMGANMAFFNGYNIPHLYNGSTVADITYTGPTADQAKALHNATVYRNRLYTIQSGSLNMWYNATNDAITGTLTQYDMTGLYKTGGYLLAIGTWTIDDGGGIDDRLVIANSEGELVIFAGAYPGSADWTRVGTFKLPRIISRRAFFNLGSDLYVITKAGIIPLSSVTNRAANDPPYRTITDKLNWQLTPSSFAYCIVDDNQEWMYYSPAASNIIYAMNTSTNSWTMLRFSGSNDIEFGKAGGKIAVINQYGASSGYRISYLGGDGQDHGSDMTLIYVSCWFPLTSVGTKATTSIIKSLLAAYYAFSAVSFELEYDWRVTTTLACTRTLSANINDVQKIPWSATRIGEVFRLKMSATAPAATTPSYQRYLGSTVTFESAGGV